MTKRKLPSNWRSRIEIVEFDREDKRFLDKDQKSLVTYHIQFVKGKSPKGFAKNIGYLVCDESDSGTYVEPRIVEWAKNRGLGKMMYEFILEKHGSISTKYHSASDEAQRVWDSLCRRYPFKTDFFSGKLTVKDKSSRKIRA